MTLVEIRDPVSTSGAGVRRAAAADVSIQTPSRLKNSRYLWDEPTAEKAKRTGTTALRG